MQIVLADIEAFIQLTIALNFAFAAFDSLRSPVQARMRRFAREELTRCVALSTELSDLHYVSTYGWPLELSEAFCGRSSDYSKVKVHEHNLRGYDTAFEESNEDWSFSVGRFAILVGLAGFVILFAMPLLQGQTISLAVYILLTLFLLSPTALLIFYNISIGQLMRDSVKDVEKVRVEITEIENRLRTQYRPTLRSAKQKKLVPED